MDVENTCDSNGIFIHTKRLVIMSLINRCDKFDAQIGGAGTPH